MKRRKRNSFHKFIKAAIITMIMITAALCGIYSARIYTTPYSGLASLFAPGTLEEVTISKEKCNILIIGTDKSGRLTDVMMLAQIDPVNDKATVMSIPRDTLYKGRKINEVHSAAYRKGGHEGSEATILAVKELTGIPIHHYVKVNTKAFKQCIDELGGVEFDVPRRMRYTDPYQDLYIDLKAGHQLLDGDKAEQLVRFRQYPRGDIDRIQVQQDFLHALAEQKLNVKYVGKIDNIYDVVVDNMETSMSPGNFVQCGQQMLGIGTENIKTITLPHTMVENASYVRPVISEIATVRVNDFGYEE